MEKNRDSKTKCSFIYLVYDKATTTWLYGNNDLLNVTGSIKYPHGKK